MKKIAMLRAVTAVLCWAPFSLHLSPAKTLSLSVDKAYARIGRPLTPLSVAGVHRRMNRRAYYRAAAATGVAAAAYGAYRYYGAPAYGAYYSSPAYTTYSSPAYTAYGDYQPAYGAYGYQPLYASYGYQAPYGTYYGGAPATTMYGDYVPTSGPYSYGPGYMVPSYSPAVYGPYGYGAYGRY